LQLCLCSSEDLQPVSERGCSDLFFVLLLLQVDGQPVAVEVDGSHHYTNSTPHIPLSEVLVRRRLLQVGSKLPM
jgi:hypothetical protein